MTIAIANIGYVLHVDDREIHQAIVEKLEYEKPGVASDSSEHTQKYALTYLGEPIGITEYAARIAQGQSTHVILLLDWDESKNAKIKQHHVDKNTPFHELVLPSRPGYNRLTAILECKIEGLYRYFKL